jgi:lipid-binding SYLF domain-containing protein
MFGGENMSKLRDSARSLIVATTAALCAAFFSGAAAAATAEDLNKDVEHSLEILYKGSPIAQDVSKRAKAVLVFPNIVKAGLIFGGAYGEGVLLKGSAPAGYYNSVSASWGLQAGAQSYGYAVFLMSAKALRYLDKSDGWELGVGPTVVVVNEGVAKNLSTSTLKSDAYAFIFDQQGLMASLSIEGTKVSRIKRGSEPAVTHATRNPENAAHKAGD